MLSLKQIIPESKTAALAGLVLSLALASPCLAADFSGQVVRILDGDTVEVLRGRTPVRVRLAEIDAPEKAQPFGQRSRQALAALVANKLVVVRDGGSDRYGRVIGHVRVNGQDVGAAQVSAGMAWVYRRYSHDFRLQLAETQARLERRGLWRDPSPTAPWAWRAEKRTQASNTEQPKIF